MKGSVVTQLKVFSAISASLSVLCVEYASRMQFTQRPQRDAEIAEFKLRHYRYSRSVELFWATEYSSLIRTAVVGRCTSPHESRRSAEFSSGHLRKAAH